MTSDEKGGLMLPGLDGTNPLGFLAALGLHRMVDKEGMEPTLRWQSANATWVPILSLQSQTEMSADDLLSLLDDHLIKNYELHPISRAISNSDTQDRCQQFFDTAEHASSDSREQELWLASIGSDAAAETDGNQLQAVRRDYFPGNLRSLISNTTREHLDRSLFHVWDFADRLDNHSLHLNPSEDRRHAYQWNKPSGDPERKYSGGMIGANRLAIEAWPLFPTIPLSSSLQTTGFSGVRSTDTRLSWPLWEVPCTLDAVRSLLCHPYLQTLKIEDTSRAMLQKLGVSAVYRSRRILVEKTPNFTPAQRIA